MSDPWVLPQREPMPPLGGPPALTTYPNLGAAGAASVPYWPAPPGPPIRRRRTGRIVVIVAAAVVLVSVLATATVIVAVRTGLGAQQSAEGPGARISGPSGTTYPILLPAGFRQGRDTDLRGGYLTAGKGGDYPPYVDVYVDKSLMAKQRDLIGVAHDVQAETRADGAKIISPEHNVTINGMLVTQWQENYAATKDSGAFRQLIAVVLVGDTDEYVEIDYNDDVGAYSATEAEQAAAGIITSLRRRG